MIIIKLEFIKNYFKFKLMQHNGHYVEVGQWFRVNIINIYKLVFYI